MRSLWLGRVDYRAAWQLQRELEALRCDGMTGDTLLLMEHPPTITLGRGANPANLLKSRDLLSEEGVAVVDVDRGGDVTYHGPGQLVGYPVFDLKAHRQDLHWFLREMEEALITALHIYGIAARRFPPHTGVWVEHRKIAAIGIRVRRWITTHGFALNVTTAPEDFAEIIPCGISDYGVTSIQDVTGQTHSVQSAARICATAFEELFGASDQFDGLPAGTFTPDSEKILADALDMAEDRC